MKFEKPSPGAIFGQRTKRALALMFCVAASGAAVSAKNIPPTKTAPLAPTARPLARLITSSPTTTRVVTTARPRLTASPVTTTARPAAILVGTYDADRVSVPAHMPAVAAVVSGDERRVLELINAQRQARGLRPLALEGSLVRAARQHSENMARQDFFDHVGRDGQSVAGRAASVGVRGWRALAENIAYNQGFADPAQFAVERWMKSAKHRENILSDAYTHTGLGVARSSDGRIFFTQVFMTR